MNRIPFIAANWKMNPATAEEARALAQTVIEGIEGIFNVEVVLCVPLVFLDIVSSVLNAANARVRLGAQDCFEYSPTGAYTGAVSPAMLNDRGVSHVIIGHSERRRYQRETNEMIHHKVHAALGAGLPVIIAVGEESRDDETRDTIATQLRGALAGVAADAMMSVTIAYEPVWAISTTNNSQPATPDDALSGIVQCRKIVADLFDVTMARSMRMIYGGSVNETNALSYVEHDGIDGLLPGGVSLDSDAFVALIKDIALRPSP